LNNSTLPADIYELHTARKYAYTEDGTLFYDCENCQWPLKVKTKLGCPHVGAAGQAVDASFTTCPGAALQHTDVLSQFYDLIRMVDGCTLINLFKHSNILYEIAMLEHSYKIEQQQQMLRQVKDVSR
jgi:hypothetical protein